MYLWNKYNLNIQVECNEVTRYFAFEVLLNKQKSSQSVWNHGVNYRAWCDWKALPDRLLIYYDRSEVDGDVEVRVVRR